MLPITRRLFLQNGSLAAVVVAVRRGIHPRHLATLRPALNPAKLEPFVDLLTIPEVIQPFGFRQSPENPSARVPYYRIAMRQINSKVHRDLQPTRVWGFGSASPGPTFETRSGEGLLVEWVNE